MTLPFPDAKVEIVRGRLVTDAVGDYGKALVREALADLRAKVQAERDKHGPGRAHDRGVHYPCGRCDALELVLDLIDKEADRG